MTLTPVQSLCDPLDVVIANGASLSSGYSLQGRILTGIYMPSAWTAAGLTFQASYDNATWFNVYDTSGELAITTAAASLYLAMDGTKFLGISFIRVRSGTAGTPVAQGAARTLVLMCGVPNRAQ